MLITPELCVFSSGEDGEVTPEKEGLSEIILSLPLSALSLVDCFIDAVGISSSPSN